MKSAIFIVLPEEDQTKYFMVSLIPKTCIRRSSLADGGQPAQEPVVFFADELGTCPPHSVAGTDVFRLPVQRTHAGAYRPEHYRTAAEKLWKEGL